MPNLKVLNVVKIASNNNRKNLHKYSYKHEYNILFNKHKTMKIGVRIDQGHTVLQWRKGSFFIVICCTGINVKRNRVV